MAKIQVLIVDDSALMRTVLSDIINQSPDMEVIGRARNGQDALDQLAKIKPDVVTMDVEMPGMDGLTALSLIMKQCPVPVIMVSSLTKRGTEQTMKALQLGAVDFIAKPSGQLSLDVKIIGEDLKRKIIIAAGARKKLQNLYRSAGISMPSASVPIHITKKVINKTASLKKLVVIGTSTGGPKALHQVIPGISSQLDAGVLVVQHMPAGFTKSLAERLDAISSLKVKEAEDGEKICPGCVYLAPGDYHLATVRQTQQGQNILLVSLNKQPPRAGHRPSVDVMLESAVQNFWAPMVCVIMTGMGSDGAAGLALIKEQGGITIVEDQSTCIVYGMPKSAVETGKVDRIVPLNNIGAEINKALQSL